MNLQLKKPELERYIDEQVKVGNFPTPEAVVEDALLLAMAQSVELTAADVAAIKRADEEMDRGEFVDFGDFASRMRNKYGVP